jgi:hypothetical protein
MDVEYIIINEACYDIEVPEGATDEEIQRAILDDINDDAYLPEGANLDIRWDAEDGRSGRLTHTIEPDVDAIMKNNGLDKCDESGDGSHEWEPSGGCNGLYGEAGTSYRIVDECTKCGLIRTYHYSGSQRRPGEPDFTVRFDWA